MPGSPRKKERREAALRAASPELTEKHISTMARKYNFLDGINEKLLAQKINLALEALDPSDPDAAKVIADILKTVANMYPKETASKVESKNQNVPYDVDSLLQDLMLPPERKQLLVESLQAKREADEEKRRATLADRERVERESPNGVGH